MDNWQADSDAHILAEAKVITDDQVRLAAAQAAAEKLAEKEAAEAKAMKAVAKNPRPTAGRSTPRPPGTPEKLGGYYE
jgi:hypothetical protein